MQISNWASTPNAINLCASMNATDGKWYGVDCQETRPFLCKHSDSVPPTPGPNGECPTSQFQDIDPSLDHCYSFTFASPLTWDEAQRTCVAMGHGSKLISIHSEAEMNKINGELAKHQSNVWLGLYTTANSGGSYFWIDGSPLDYVNWAENEPNNPDYELCIEAFSQDGKWNDRTCDNYYSDVGYVCKAPKVQVTDPTVKPSSTTSPGSSTTKPTTLSSVSSSSTSKGSTSEATTTTTLLYTIGSDGLSGGVVAIIVIVCLVGVSGGVVVMLMLFKRESYLRKLMANRQTTPPYAQQQNDGSFGNPSYMPEVQETQRPPL